MCKSASCLWHPAFRRLNDRLQASAASPPDGCQEERLIATDWLCVPCFCPFCLLNSFFSLTFLPLSLTLFPFLFFAGKLASHACVSLGGENGVERGREICCKDRFKRRRTRQRLLCERLGAGKRESGTHTLTDRHKQTREEQDKRRRDYANTGGKLRKETERALVSLDASCALQRLSTHTQANCCNRWVCARVSLCLP